MVLDQKGTRLIINHSSYSFNESTINMLHKKSRGKYNTTAVYLWDWHFTVNSAGRYQISIFSRLLTEEEKNGLGSTVTQRPGHEQLHIWHRLENLPEGNPHVMQLLPIQSNISPYRATSLHTEQHLSIRYSLACISPKAYPQLWLYSTVDKFRMYFCNFLCSTWFFLVILIPMITKNLDIFFFA